jgi:RNA polymerase sigma-70 factor (ECF subfamily)
MDFRRLFDEHASYVFHSLARLGVPDHHRDDLVQEVFMTVHALFEDYDPTRPFRPWVFAIAYRISLRYRRKSASNREILVEAEAPSTDAGPLEALEAMQARERLRRALAQVELHRRAVLILKDIDGQSIPEIAHALGIPLNTAYSRLRLARADLAGILTAKAAKEVTS